MVGERVVATLGFGVGFVLPALVNPSDVEHTSEASRVSTRVHRLGFAARARRLGCGPLA